MIENSIKYVIEKLTKASIDLTELAEKIQNALVEIGVDCKNSIISIGVNHGGIEPYLIIIPIRDLEDKIFFEYSGGVLYTRHRYIDESGILKVNKSENVDFYKEYRSYILKKFKEVMGIDYQYDKMIVIEPYMTWYDQNKEELENKAHRLIENRKCHNAFDLIRLCGV